jgi:iron(II)-dependent oxidoreductase
VTNRQFRQFVASGGYENMSLWEPEVWPALLDLVDRTGHPGPRFWKDGKYPRGQHDHPVTGVSWYEAAAYARWVGKRLPTDPEWVKAAAWPVSLPGTRCVERAYPWGDSMDRSRANLWGSGPGATVSVREHAAGASVGGVYQLIGNVWEWTGGDYGSLDLDGEAGGTNLIKSLRGGAFDTYFDLQAGIQFQSGDYPLVRKHNIGFRCALGLCDLSGSQQEGFNDEEHLDEQLAEELA